MRFLKGLSLRKVRLDSLDSMYWNVFLRGMGTAMMGLFVPIYIFLIGKEQWGLVGGLRLLAVYLIVQRLLLFLITIPMARIVGMLGFRFSVLLGNLLLVVYYLIPVFFGEKVWVVLAMSLVSVLLIPLYWLSRHSLLAVDGQKGKFGKEVGMVTLLDRGAGVLAPVVGGVIATVFGFEVLFILGAVVVMMSCVPLFFMKHHKKDGVVTWRSFFEWLKDSDKKHLWRGFAGEGMDVAATQLFWPVYVFLMIGSLEILGGLTSVSMLLAMVTTYLAGKSFDRRRALGGNEDEKMYWGSDVVFALLRLMRAGFSSLWGLFGIDALSKTVSAYYWVPYGGYIYSAGKDNGGLKLYAYREMVYSFSVVLVGVFIFLISAFSFRWWGIFGISALGILLTLGMAKES